MYLHDLVPLYTFVAIIIVLSVVLKKLMPMMLGYAGESGVRKQLLTLDSSKYMVLNDLYLPNGRGGTSQVDHLVVSTYGLFVIETKNYSGQIYGKETDQYWTVVNYRRKDRLKNPFYQNYGHIQAIKHVLGDDADVFFISIVSFTGSAKIKVTCTPKPGTELVGKRQVSDTIKKYVTPTLSGERFVRIVEKLNSARLTDKGIRRKHVQGVKGTIQANKDTVKKGICPRCGGQLVSRKGKYGSFRGCSNFPKCRFKERGA